MNKTWRVESGMRGYGPEYISDEYNTRDEALNDAVQCIEVDTTLTETAWEELKTTGHLALSSERFTEPEDSIYPNKDTSLWYIRIEEGPFDYDNTSERT